MDRRTLLALLPAALTAAPAKWRKLFDGKTLTGWTALGGEWQVRDGAILCDGGTSGWLRCEAGPFADFALEVDFRTAADGNSGIFVRSARDGQPWVSGYEVQIFDQHPKYPTGSFVNDILAQGGKIRPGAWQRMAVRAQGDHFHVSIDGKPVLDGASKKSATGYIGLQYNKGRKIEFRRIRIQTL